MRNGAERRPSFDIARMRDDIARKGWLPTTLAKRAGVSDMTVSRFLRAEAQTAPTAKKLAKALGYSIGRYLISATREEAASA